MPDDLNNISDELVIRARDIACGAPTSADGDRKTYVPKMPTVETMRAALAEVLAAKTVAEPGVAPTKAERDVISERRDQIMVRGYTEEHDDAQANGEMIDHDHRGAFERLNAYVNDRHPNPRHCLVETAALIIAEIERLDRANARRDAEGWS